jgi:peptide/nickel transport system permease protein
MALADVAARHRAPGAGADLSRRVLGSPALRVAGRRLLTAIPVLWGVTFLTYAIMSTLPNNSAQIILGINANPAAIAALNHKLGLDQPFFVQYWHWFTGLLHGSLGNSIANNQTVNENLGQRLPTSAVLLVYSLFVTLVLAIAMAIFSARKPNGIVDRIGLVLATLGLSIAPYVLALLVAYIFGSRLRWFPVISGNIGNTPVTWFRTLTLPAISLGFGLFAVYSRLLRADIVEQMQREDYIVTARAKGVAPWRVLLRHATRNSLFGLITLIGLNLGTLVGALAIIEPLFNVPGIGDLLINAIQLHDVPVIEGIVLVFALMTVLGNLLADLAYAVLDPRIRYGRSTS